jgi:hypothetical protein
MTDRKSRGTVFLVTAALGIILVPVILSVAGYSLGNELERSLFLDTPIDVSKGCVETTEYMRFHHMDLLKNLREQTVRNGKPGKVTFDTCRQCHQTRASFCNRCHEAASVRLDCFGCHYYPLD